MNTSTQFPALMGPQALPGLSKDGKTPKSGVLKHPLGSTKMQHPLAKGGKTKC